MLDKVLSLVAPHECVGCRTDAVLLCTACEHELSSAISRCYRCHGATTDWRTCNNCRRRSKLYSLSAKTRYDTAGEALIRKLKYGQAVAAADIIAEELVSLLPKSSDLFLTYLPTASSRVRKRGFDQARLITKALAKDTKIPYVPLLIRVGQDRQVGAGRADRYQHASEMFRVRNESLLAGQNVVIIDDVVTTGASLEAAAAVLRANGAKRVYGLVFCQA